MTRYHPTLGKGIVLQKYSYTNAVKKEVSDYDEQEITIDKNSKVYQDALAIALESGQGYSEINWDEIPFEDMNEHLILEDVPDLSHLPVIGDLPEIVETHQGCDITDKINDAVVDILTVPTMPDITTGAIDSMPGVPEIGDFAADF